MKFIANFGKFWYDFIVGDDWFIAAGGVILIAVTALLVSMDVNAWWVLLLGTPLALFATVKRAAK
jgi:uncharacterized membrane protein